MTFYHRKSPRIPHYDYSAENYYFITICTNNRRCIFGQPNKLNALGEIAKKHIEQIGIHYDHISVEKYVVMPNHIHMILCLNNYGCIDSTQIIGLFKSGVSREISKRYGKMRVWQRSFHDHVIRSQADHERIWLYIEGNPHTWEKDCFYAETSIIRDQY